MKKQLFLTFFTLLLLTTSCGNSPNSPKGIANQFLAFVSKGKYEEAKAFGTSNTVMYLNFSEQMMPEGMDKTFGYKILRDSVVGDHAWVFFYDERTEKEESLDLIKVDNKWKVDLRMKK